MRIVERCRWLADPIEARRGRGLSRLCRLEADDRAPAGAWSAVPYLATEDAYDEHRQVLAQQFSPFIEQWVARLLEGGCA